MVSILQDSDGAGSPVFYTDSNGQTVPEDKEKGDRIPVASEIAQQVGMDDYQAELLPEDKLQAIYNLRHQGTVGMVGDGINDTPALAAADVSFAVGNIVILPCIARSHKGFSVISTKTLLDESIPLTSGWEI